MPGPFDKSNIQSVISRMMDDGSMPAASAEPSAEVPSKPSKVPLGLSLGVMGAGQLADALSTNAAIKRGAVEGNSGIYGDHPSFGRVAATKAATMAPLALLLYKLYNSHPKLAEGIALGAGGVGFGLAAHNSHTGRK